MFDSPKQDEFTQGTVFSCAYAEEYRDASVYGLVITARCDAAQDKAPIFSFIPLVSLTDWMSHDGAQIAMDRIHSECQNVVRNYLKMAGLSESLLATKSLEDIYGSHFSPKAGEKAWTDRCSKIRAAVETHAINTNLRPPVGPRSERIRHLADNQGKVDAVVKELCGNRLSGHYLLRSMPTTGEAVGDYVALLREIHHIPSDLARKIVRGISFHEWKPLQSLQSEAQRCPCFLGDDDLAAPVAKLRSPWIEHVMQSFTMLFARIGVADNDFAAVKRGLSQIGLG